MLNKKTKTEQRETTNSGINVIGSGTSIEGDLTSNGDIRVDGTIQGTLRTTAKLVLGKSGKIEGSVHAQNADMSGTVKGDVHIKEVLQLQSSSRVYGDIRTGKLIVESGGEFNGKCTMGAPQADINSKRGSTTSDPTQKSSLVG